MPVQYVEYGGTQMLQPPYVAQDVGLYGFVVKADMGALQKLLDARLNLPSGGKEHFEPAGPFVIFVYNTLGKMFSVNPPDRDKGWFSEQECAVWVRVVDVKRERSMWFHPYMFVDNSYAMALGREVYGFPKALGWFDIPADPKTATKLSMETLALPVFSPNTAGVRMKLIEATQITPSDDPLKIVTTAAEFGAEMLGMLAENDGLGALELIRESVVDLFERKEPMVFLKQFPASDTPGVACYQGIDEMTATATALHGVCLVRGQWQIDIMQAASHPIATDLGLAGNTVQSALQFWVSFDMIVGLGENVWTADTSGRREKIAILGGGVGAMTTALELTGAKDWKDRYDITVYQMGWRLGGKGASGRGECDRIEEHGLHIWLGFYENAFRIMRQVYEENKVNRPPGTPLREWDEAFKQHNFVAVTDCPSAEACKDWALWSVHFPEVPGTPGDGKPLTLWDSFLRILGWVEELYRDSAFHSHNAQTEANHGFLSDLKGVFGHLVPNLAELGEVALIGQLELARKVARLLDKDPRKHPFGAHEGLAKLIEHFRKSVRAKIQVDLDANDLEIRRLFEIIDLAVSVGIGLLRDGYFLNPANLDTLEDEFQTWLAKQGADPVSCDIDQSAVIRGIYDLVFAYRNGDVSQPSFEAGPAIRAILLIAGAYKGSVFWKMQAGMGDVVFGPMYQVLKDRGVKFEFFHKVEELTLNPDGTNVDSIRIGVQATLRNPVKGYDPLVVCEGLPSWPADPRYDQLKEGEKLKAEGVNLESFWSTWQNPSTKILKAGQDYDRVVLGISLGALPYLFADDAKLPECFQLMLQNVETVRTQAIQLWVDQTPEELGWDKGSVVLDAYSTPINTWAIMEQLMPRESWPPGLVKGTHYFCGQMAGGIPPQNDVDAPKKALAEVEATYEEFIEKYLPFLWPKMKESGMKVVSKFLRANIDPTERYVLSVAGSTKYRLRANESGLGNVVLAGDWTHNGFNAGCVEAAAMSGIQAANAIEGKPLDDGIDGPLAPQLRAVAAASGALP